MSLFQDIKQGIVNNRWQLGYGIVDTLVENVVWYRQHEIKLNTNIAKLCLKDKKLQKKIANSKLENLDEKVGKVWKQIAANPQRAIVKNRCFDILWTGVKVLPTLGLALSAATVTGLLGPIPVTVIVLTPVINKVVHLAVSTIKPESTFYDHVDKLVDFSFDYVKLGVIVASKLTGGETLKEAATTLFPYAVMLTVSKVASFMINRKIFETNSLVNLVLPVTFTGGKLDFENVPFLFIMQSIYKIADPFLFRYKDYNDSHKRSVNSKLNHEISKLQNKKLETMSSVAKRAQETCDAEYQKKVSTISDFDPKGADKVENFKLEYSDALEKEKKRLLDEEIEVVENKQKVKRQRKDVIKDHQEEAQTTFKGIEAREWVKSEVSDENRPENPNCEFTKENNTRWYVTKILDLSKLVDQDDDLKTVQKHASEMIEDSPYNISNTTESQMISLIVKALEKTS